MHHCVGLHTCSAELYCIAQSVFFSSYYVVPSQPTAIHYTPAGKSIDPVRQCTADECDACSLSVDGAVRHAESELRQQRDFRVRQPSRIHRIHSRSATGTLVHHTVRLQHPSRAGRQLWTPATRRYLGWHGWTAHWRGKTCDFALSLTILSGG